MTAILGRAGQLDKQIQGMLKNSIRPADKVFNMKNVLTVRNLQQKVLFLRELRGQLSDG